MDMLKKFVVISVLAISILGAMGCSTPNDGGADTNGTPQTVTVTFIQVGYENKVFYVNYGESFTQIPTVNAKKGYQVTWETVNLSDIKEDLQVHAVEIPNVYTVDYELGMDKATVANAITEIAYDATYQLEIPVCAGFKFLGWEVKETGDAFPISGTYTVDGDLTLVAQWELDEQSSEGWLPPV